MAAKPDITLARWATDNTNNTPPTGGQRDTGWTPGQTGVSDYDNEIKRQLYFWALYLNDGDLSGNFEIDGDLLVTGDLDIDGSITDVTSITMSGVLHRPSRFYMVSAFDFSPDWDDGIVNGSVIDHGTNFSVNGYLQYDDPGALTRRSYCGLPVRDGEQVFALVLRIREDTAEEVSMKFYKLNYNTGTRTQIGTTQTSGNSTDDDFLLLMPSEDIDDQHFYWIELDHTATASALRVYGLICQILVP